MQARIAFAAEQLGKKAFDEAGIIHTFPPKKLN
jgi:hypothetical protein